ncbi:MAG: hypothetical protein GY730_03385 [bacterium]|nr:hypothetical protein [bacterium]
MPNKKTEVLQDKNAAMFSLGHKEEHSADLSFGMANIEYRKYLFAVTSDNKLWMRDSVPQNEVWRCTGRTDYVTAMTAINGKLFIATLDNELWMRYTVYQNNIGHANRIIGWHIGHANNVVAMAAINGKLFAATSDNKLWMRDPVPRNIAWRHIGHADNVVAMAATRRFEVFLTENVH